MDTEKMAAKVAELFDLGYGDKAKFTVKEGEWNGHAARFVSAGQMYEVPTYKGDGGIIGMLTKIQEACEGNRIDETGGESISGCETCDYGSFYSREFVVWKE